MDAADGTLRAARGSRTHLALGFAAGGAALWSYAAWGFAYWMLGAMGASLYFFSEYWRPAEAFAERTRSRLRRRDLWCCAGLGALFFVPYLYNVFSVPYQMNTDEFVFMQVARSVTDEPTPDLFGLAAGYYHFPLGSFALIGWACRLLGGITLEHARLVNGAVGWLSVLGVFLLFRFYLNRRMAFLGALAFGASHALVGLSRMAIRDNLPVLIAAAALLVLSHGFRRRDGRLLFLGGACAALGLYNYNSGRWVFLIWLAFLGFSWIRRPTWPRLRATARSWAPAFAGFLLAAAPYGIAVAKAPPDAANYGRAQLILYPEGRALVRSWEGTDDTARALTGNWIKGLTAFNGGRSDGANIYNNRGHGFVDPLTGVLLWLGIARIFFRRARKRMADLLALAGFLLIWLALTTLATKNPAYSRMLPILIFVTYFALQGAWWIAGGLGRLNGFLRRRRTAVLTACVLCAVGWNAAIVYDHYRQAMLDGDPPGATIRYVAERAAQPGYRYYLVMDKRYPYFFFGEGAWKEWCGLFTGKDQSVELITSEPLLKAEPEFPFARPFSILLCGELWNASQWRLRKAFPEGKAHALTPDGSQMAFEVP